MMPRDLHLLPTIRDSLSFLYVDRARIEQADRAIEIVDANGTTAVPCAAVSTVLLGPGTVITHAAVRVLAESGCSVIWVGEGAVRTYACGTGETRSSRNQLAQIRAWASSDARIAVVRRMYAARFDEELADDLTIEQIRGLEGVRVREAYQRASTQTGLPWSGRAYDRGNWQRSDPVNRALSAANSCLYGICHAAIVSAGFLPALGFIHTGRMLSFVYDIADLYKTDLTIPMAFEVAAAGHANVEQRVRRSVREAAYGARLLQRIVPDIRHVLGLSVADDQVADAGDDPDGPGFPPGELWSDGGSLPGGINWGSPPAEE